LKSFSHLAPNHVAKTGGQAAPGTGTIKKHDTGAGGQTQLGMGGIALLAGAQKEQGNPVDRDPTGDVED
jgi:hypothetical protein